MYVKIELTDRDWEYLRKCARIRRISMSRLCSRLLRDIARDFLVRAVLDDDSRPTEGRPYRARCELYQ